MFWRFLRDDHQLGKDGIHEANNVDARRGGSNGDPVAEERGGPGEGKDRAWGRRRTRGSGSIGGTCLNVPQRRVDEGSPFDTIWEDER